MKKILICASAHDFGTVLAVAEMMANGLRLSGHSVVVFEITYNDGPGEVVQYLKANEIDLVISLSPSLLRLRYRLRRLHDYIKSPTCVFLLDDPAYHFREIEALLNRCKLPILFLAPELNQVDELNGYISSFGIRKSKAKYFPWAGPAPKYLETNTRCAYDCAVFCTLDQQIKQGVEGHALILEIKKKYQTKNADVLLHRMADGIFLESISSLFSELTHELYNLGDPMHRGLWMRLDSYVKKTRRLAMARELIKVAEKEHLKFRVCGTGWDKIGALPDSISMAGPLHYNSQFDVFRNSRFQINLDPNWTHGTHDRVFNGMSVGCAVITNENDFVSENFVAGKELATFKAFAELPELLLKSDAIGLGNSGLAAYQKSHTWHSRMDNLVETLERTAA